MAKCARCHRIIRELSFRCHRCNNLFCSKHRLPEDHNCYSLKKENKWKKENWKNVSIESDNFQENTEIEEHLEKKQFKFKTYWRRLIYWLNDYEFQSYSYSRRLNYLILNFIKLVISLFIFIIVYNNIDKLNEIVIWIIKIGSILLLIAIFFIVKYSYKLIIEIPNWFKRQRRWIRYFILLIILILLGTAYYHRDTIFNPAVDFYNKINFRYFFPLNLDNLNEINGISSIVDNKPKNYESNALSKLNEFRVKERLLPLEFDEGLYNDAILLSKNIYNNESLQKNLRISSIKLEHYENESIKNAELNSIGDKLSNKIYDRNSLRGYTYGAVGCYKFVCVFVVDFKSSGYKALENDKKYNYDDKNINTGISSPLRPSIDLLSLEKDIHNLINEERNKNGLGSLSWDDKLSDVARGHSGDMANNNFFSHDNLAGQDPTARAVTKGYNCYKNYGSYYIEGIAENIFQNNLYDSTTYVNGIPVHDWSSQSEIASSTVNGWMNSPGHRQNILTSTYEKEGIGIAISSDDKVYITENFC